MTEINKKDIAPYYFNNETTSHRFVRTVAIAGLGVLAWNYVLELGEPVSIWFALVALLLVRALVYSIASAASWGWYGSNLALREIVTGMHSIISYKIDLDQQEAEAKAKLEALQDELAQRRDSE